jgi:hypothetical protein
MHPRYAPYYIRRVRISSSDPLFRMLKDQGLPFFPDTGQTYDSASTFVFEFPVKAPENPDKIYSGKLNALEQLEYWKKVKKFYTEHNPSVTITVSENEWIDVAHWLWENWYIIGGLSFLPKDDHVYQLAPYEEISKERYEEMAKRFADANIDYSRIVTYEKDDQTEGSKELACVAGICDVL